MKSTRRKRLIMTTLLAILLLLLTSCQKDGQDFKLSLFTNLPNEAEQTIQSVIQNRSNGEQNVEVQVFSPMYEKLIVEIIDHSGDIILMEKELLSAVFEPGGLYPLDSIKGVTDIETKEFQLEDVNGNVHVYALPIPSDSILLRDFHINDTTEIIAIIPIYTKHKEMAYELLTTLVTNH